MKSNFTFFLKRGSQPRNFFCTLHALKFIFILCLFLSFNASFAQVPVQVKGYVINEKGAPLSGGSVTLEGKASGATTDAKGFFSITAPDSKSVLTISFVGYQPQQIIAGKSREVNFKLFPSNANLNEVVVVGYPGAYPKKNFSRIIWP